MLAGGLFLVVNAVRLRLTASEATVGAVASGYVNANNIGLPACHCRLAPAAPRLVAAATTSAVIKAVVMPVLAFALARYVFRLDDDAVLGAVLVAGLPTAQNVYNYAARYRRGEVLARDTILITTLVSPATLLIAAAILG